MKDQLKQVYIINKFIEQNKNSRKTKYRQISNRYPSDDKNPQPYKKPKQKLNITTVSYYDE